jgi:outer membrane protein assembly factor BamB
MASRGWYVLFIVLLLVLGSTTWVSVDEGVEGGPSESPWPTFQGDMQRTGRSEARAPHSDGSIRWTTKASSDFTTSPVIGPSGTVYLGTQEGALFAIGPFGTTLWTFDTGGPIRSTPMVTPDGHIIFGSQDGAVYCVSPRGVMLWSFPTGGAVTSSPAMGEDGTIYVGSEDQNLYALDGDGMMVWSFETDGPITAAPTIGHDGMVRVGSHDGFMYTVLPDGTQEGAFMTYGIVRYAAALGPQAQTHFGSWDGNLYTLVDSSGSNRTYLANAPPSAPPSIGEDGTLYFGTGQNVFVALRPDGTEWWEIDVEWTDRQEGNSSVTRVGTTAAAIAGDGTIYVGDAAGNFMALSPDGDVLWNHSFPGYILQAPAIGRDGTVYVPHHDELTAFGTRGDEGRLWGNVMIVGAVTIVAVVLFIMLLTRWIPAWAGPRRDVIDEVQAAVRERSLGPAEEDGPHGGGEGGEGHEDRKVEPEG